MKQEKAIVIASLLSHANCNGKSHIAVFDSLSDIQYSHL